MNEASKRYSDALDNALAKVKAMIAEDEVLIETNDRLIRALGGVPTTRPEIRVKD